MFGPPRSDVECWCNFPECTKRHLEQVIREKERTAMFDAGHRGAFYAAILTGLGIVVEEDSKKGRLLVRLPTYVPKHVHGDIAEAMRAVSPMWTRVEVRIEDLQIVDARPVVDAPADPFDEALAARRALLLLTGPTGGRAR